MKIVADANIPFIEEFFGNCGELVLKPGRKITPADVKDAEILLVRSITRVNEALLKGSKVKFVGSVTAGSDHLDTKWLTANGIEWHKATGFNAPPVADYVVSVVAALQRNQMLTSNKLRAAVIGVGNVGALVVERLRSLKIEVVLCDPVRAEHEKNFHSTDLNAIENVDLITLSVPLTKSGDHPTRHLINKDFLARQKKGAVLLNASRGAVVNSEDLLAHGKHLEWCLDVFENEPHIDKRILEQAFIATPHIAGYSVQSKMRGIEMIYKIAYENKFIQPPAISCLPIPSQRLDFAGVDHQWRDIVLGVFNPLVITMMMRALLLPAQDCGPLFDEMRNKFNYRYEFGSTKIMNANVKDNDKKLLRDLGLLLQ